MAPHSSEGIPSQGQEFHHLHIVWKFVAKQPRWLIASWVSLFAISMLALVLYIVGTPIYFARLSHVYTICRDECLTQAKIQTLHTLGISIPIYAAYWTGINLLFALVYCTVAALIFWRKPFDPVAWFASLSLVALGTSFPSIPNALVSVHSTWWLPITLLDALGLPSLTTFLLLFPSGRFVPRWTCWVAVAFATLYVLGTFFPGTYLGYVNLPRLFHPLVPLAVLSIVIFAQIYRYRRVSTPLERQQTKWVVFGAIIALIGFASAFLLSSFLSLDRLSLLISVFTVTSIYLLLLLIPLSIAFAILRYHLWDIDLIIKRTVVYGILTTCVIGIYVLVVGYLGTLFHTQSSLVISLLATGLVAVIFHPLKELLQRSVNRLLYGQRDEPYHVISRLGQRLEATLAPDAVLTAIVETVAQALKLPYSAISLKHDQAFSIAASYGTEVETLLHVPLMYQTEQVGELLLAPRARGESFTPADRRLLDDLARQVGIAAHAVRLTADLQQSRERLVTAREEERRRLRRDLHDGLGPTLASITLKLDATRNLLTRDPTAADALLIDLKKQTQAAVSDIRRLVYDLRPPSLDELGLIQALREQTEQYNYDRLRITIEAPEPLPSLPAAVEVATYRIVQEAITNVIRHSQACNCTIRFALNHGLDIEICDDGRGISTGQRAGVGLTSIRERVAELGGICEIEAQPISGTRLHVRLPLPKAAELEGVIDGTDSRPDRG